jgi:hypothetical protein
MSPNGTDALRDELSSVCRTAIGDGLRSITYFTRDEAEQFYLRQDLEAFAENERLGFTSQETYGDTELGDYQFTIRAFEWGYLTRVIVGDHGVFVTTDPLRLTEFEDVATAVASVLESGED